MDESHRTTAHSSLAVATIGRLRRRFVFIKPISGGASDLREKNEEPPEKSAEKQPDYVRNDTGVTAHKRLLMFLLRTRHGAINEFFTAIPAKLNTRKCAYVSKFKMTKKLRAP